MKEKHEMEKNGYVKKAQQIQREAIRLEEGLKQMIEGTNVYMK